MANETKLTVILHADVVGSTGLVQRDERLAHDRIQDAFRRFAQTIASNGGTTHEIRGDALVAGFDRASDAVNAAVTFQAENLAQTPESEVAIWPLLRIGIALGEVIIADGTLTGAGVVLAQRLEQLAEAGGCVVQGAITEAVPHRMPFQFEFMGEKQLKGFDSPVRAFRAERIGGRPAQPLEAIRGSDNSRAFELPELPSLAVLPFENLTRRNEDDPFVAGLTQQVTSVLARLRGLLVTAHSSARTYKNTQVTAKEAAGVLGVRYILEGSLQKAGQTLRVSAQLVDTIDDAHLWTETYDRTVDDYFEIQDQLAFHIALQLQGQLTAGDKARLRPQTTRDLKAFLLLQEATAEFVKFEKVANLSARQLAQQALERDPRYVQAWVMLGWTHAYAARAQLGTNPASDWAAVEKFSSKAIELDPDLSGSYHLQGYVRQFRDRDFDAAEELYDIALDKQPNDADCLAMVGTLAFLRGDWGTAIKMRQRAIRLHPLYPEWYLVVLGWALVFDGKLDEAIHLAGAGLERWRSVGCHGVLVQAYIAAGRVSDAHSHALAILDLEPQRTAEFYAQLYPFTDPDHAALFHRRFVEAGLPAGERS